MNSKNIQKLKDRIKELEEENHILKEEKEKIKKEFDEFKAKHLGTVENLRKALNIKANSKKGHKPLGAPKGHDGYTKKIPERVDIIKPLIAKRCPHCNTKLNQSKKSKPRKRYVTDIKLTSKIKTTLFEVYRAYCPKCRKAVEPEVPNVLPYARFGLNLMLLVMYLKLGLRLPSNKICDYFMNMYNLSISDGEIYVILRQLKDVFEGYYKYLEKILKKSRIAHTDSTSWRINGKNYFSWVFITTGVVLYKIKKRNNHKVPLAVLGKSKNERILVVDRHSAFRTLAEKAGFLLQLCWSHILQDSKELARDFGKEGKYVHKRLKEIFERAKESAGIPEMIGQLQGDIFQLTNRHYKHLTVWRFVNNLWKRDINNLFRFVADSKIDPTNNISERQLRELVVIRKISNCSRSNKGAEITATLLSAIQTLRMNKQNVLRGLSTILKNPSGY